MSFLKFYKFHEWFFFCEWHYSQFKSGISGLTQGRRSGLFHIPRKTGEAVRRASRLSGPWDTCSPVSVDLLRSLRCPTMTSGPALPGPSWRFALTELTVRRKAPSSYLPSGNEPPDPSPDLRLLELGSAVVDPTCIQRPFSISVAWPFGCPIVPTLLQVFQMYPTPLSTDLPFTRAFLSLYFCLRNWGGGV